MANSDNRYEMLPLRELSKLSWVVEYLVFIPVGRRVPNTKWILPPALPPAIKTPGLSMPSPPFCQPRPACPDSAGLDATLGPLG